MQQVVSTMLCPLPGFETFGVTYNLMATAKQLEQVQGSLGDGDTVDRTAVIVDMSGWPEQAYPGGPFGENSPVLVQIWALRTGFGQAVAEYVNSPFSMTKS